MTISCRRWSKRKALTRSGWVLTGAIAFLWVPSVVFSWLLPLSTSSIGINRIATTPLFSSTEGFESESDSEDEEEPAERTPEDYTGKTIYQRTFYRLSPDSQVQLPNSIMIEERLRFLPDTARPGYILPVGPRTLILREGSEEDDITDELFRMDLLAPSKSGDNPSGAHNGPRSVDTEIASVLYLASNPDWIQGDVLELSCAGTAGASGVVGLLSCVASRLATMTAGDLEAYKQQRAEAVAQEDTVLDPAQKTDFESVFPPRMHHLTLSDESPESLQGISELIRRSFASFSGKPPVSVQQLEWTHSRGPGRRRYEREYRTILGSDLDLTFPTAKELSKTVANSLLPSNEFAVANIKEGAQTSPSFGGIGMDIDPSQTSSQQNKEKETNPDIPATFVHLCPEYRDETRYLRQFLEKGYRMSVRTNYVNMERLQFYFQTLPIDASESDLEDLEQLEVQEDSSKDYQSLTAIHHPDYAGEGSGEYFFPLETGAYEGGLSSLETEEGGKMF